MTVNYSAKGESKTKTIMSFANPAIYNLIKTLKGGETLDVEFVKDDKYFNWATAKVVEQEAPSSGGQVDTSPRKVESKSNWETSEERARKQVYIIKQSCLAQAVAYINGQQHEERLDELKLAQKYVDWVLHEDKPDVFDQPNDL
jgi:hypothetical protein